MLIVVAYARSKAAKLCLFLAIQTFAGAGARLTVAANTRAPVVWTLDNIKLVGGHRPSSVLGAPKVVDVVAGGPSMQFNGQSDGLILPANPLRRWTKFTIEVLFLPEADSPPAQRFVHIQDERGRRVTLETRSADGKSWSLDTYLLCGESRRTLLDRTNLHPVGKWAWVALVYDGKKMAHYVNGMKELEGKGRLRADGRWAHVTRRSSQPGVLVQGLHQGSAVHSCGARARGATACRRSSRLVTTSRHCSAE